MARDLCLIEPHTPCALLPSSYGTALASADWYILWQNVQLGKISGGCQIVQARLMHTLATIFAIHRLLARLGTITDAESSQYLG